MRGDRSRAGAGIGGVATAARLAKAGLEVIVVEKVGVEIFYCNGQQLTL